MIDEVIFFEDLPAQIAKLCQRLGIKNAPSLPHHEQSSAFRASHNLPDYFSPEKTAAVIERFEWAFDRFGYSTDPVDYLQKPKAVSEQIAQERAC